jgi:hypothetical protein
MGANEGKLWKDKLDRLKVNTEQAESRSEQLELKLDLDGNEYDRRR